MIVHNFRIYDQANKEYIYFNWVDVESYINPNDKVRRNLKLEDFLRRSNATYPTGVEVPITMDSDGLSIFDGDYVEFTIGHLDKPILCTAISSPVLGGVQVLYNGVLDIQKWTLTALYLMSDSRRKISDRLNPPDQGDMK